MQNRCKNPKSDILTLAQAFRNNYVQFNNKWAMRGLRRLANGSDQPFYTLRFEERGRYPPPLPEDLKGFSQKDWLVIRILPPQLFIAFLYKHLDLAQEMGMNQSAEAQDALNQLNEKLADTAEVCGLLRLVL